MKPNPSLFAIQMQRDAAVRALGACNALSGRFGLTLTGEQMLRLTEQRFQALRSTGRIELGEGC